MKRIITALFFGLSLLLASGGISYSADFEKGAAAYVEGDYAIALQEFSALAEQGNAPAQTALGLMYQNGDGVLQDYKEAAKWYRIAAEYGNVLAQHNLGWMYSNGNGVLQDDKQALNWYRKSAKQGYAVAQLKIGIMYYQGNGALQDNIYAHMWLNIAASNGNTDAAEARDIIAERLTTSDMSKAQELARECVAKNYKGC